LDSSIQDATVPFPLQKRFLLVVSVLRVRLLPIIGGALRTGGGLTACRFAVLTDRPTLLLRFQRHFKRQSERS